MRKQIQLFALCCMLAAIPAAGQALEPAGSDPAFSGAERRTAASVRTSAGAGIPAPEAAATNDPQTPQPDGKRPLTINEKRRQRGITEASNLFVPKGQWIFGGTASYSTHTNDSYTFMVVENIDSKGYNFKISPLVAYAFRNNMALGARFIYGRTLQKIDKADIEMGEEDSGVNLKVQDYYGLKHSYSAAVIWRQFIPLGRNKRFAFFTETQLAMGGTQAKFATDAPGKGTYQTGYNMSLGISPGIVAFATNNMAVEVNVGVMGLSYSSTKQVHNQVKEGRFTSSMMNFRVNIFSIGVGVAFYL